MNTEIHPTNRLLGRKQAARYLTEQLNCQTSNLSLEKLASQGGGPAYCKIGRRVYYAVADLEAWVKSRTSPIFRSTSHEAELRRLG